MDLDFTYDPAGDIIALNNNVRPDRSQAFDYAASGQVISDTRYGAANDNIYTYGLNARGRMSSVTRDGSLVASYTYDESEQRIIKTAANQTTHYHYDLEGRLIAETVTSNRAFKTFCNNLFE